MGWTKAQEQAINRNQCNMLVSAAAGSGKTAVLTERIVNKIATELDVDRLLIMTFTKAAAAEMRERIGKAIAERLDNGTGDTERFCRQQALLSKSNICTIDSFCNEVVMKNFTISGVDSSFSIGDSNELELLQSEVLEDMLEEEYAAGDPVFLVIADLFADKSDDGNLEQVLIRIHQFIHAMPDPVEWLTGCVENYEGGGFEDFGETLWGSTVLEFVALAGEEFVAETETLLSMAQLSGIASYEKALLSDCQLFQTIYKAAVTGSWRQTYDAICNTRFTTARRSKNEDPEIAEQIKNQRNKIKESFKKFLPLFHGSSSLGFEEMADVKPYMEKLSALVIKFDELYTQKKNERHLMSFADVNHKALQVLRVPEIAQAYREKFQEIYIDEYQDTNTLQEAIIHTFARKDNVFMVGDVKQSIYGFRNACPELFMEKEHNFVLPETQKANEDCLVELSANFRSRKEVLESINQVFGKIMNLRTCGTAYGEGQKLHYGATYYDGLGGDFQSELLICQGGIREETDVIANRIRRLFQSGFQVYDKDLNGQRPIQYSDIVILCRQTSDIGAEMAARLQAHGIPAYVPEKGGFFSHYDVNVILSYIGIIDNPLQDIPLLTVLRSPLVGFDDNKLAEIRLNNRTCLLYESMRTMEDEQVKAFLNTLERYRQEAFTVPISQFIWKLITETGYYEYVGSKEDGAKRQANLRMLFSKAVAFEKNGRKGFFRFINHIEKLKRKESEWDAADDLNEGMNVVRIVTIHKSKGLEYPVVFLARAGKDMGKRQSDRKMLISSELGISLYRYNREKDLFESTIMAESIELIRKRKEMAEEMRVLYVAMTRAREKLIVTAAEKNLVRRELQGGSPTVYHVLNAKSYADWIFASGDSERWKLEFFEELPLVQTIPSECIVSKKSESVLPRQWSYPHISSETLPLKMSVSEIKSRFFDAETEQELKPLEEISIQPFKTFLVQHSGRADEAAFTPTQTGLLLHSCLERVDYQQCRKAIQQSDPQSAMEAVVEATVQSMAEQGHILPEEKAAIDIRIPVAFLLSDVGKRLLASEDVRREVPFTILKDAHELQAGTEGKVSIQGVIDCCFKEDGEFVIVDYKSDRVYGEEAEERASRYKTQIALYGEALERITGITVKEKIVFFLRSKQAFYF